MPERIFPTQLKEQLGSKLEFNGIDIDTLVTKLAEHQEDSKKDALSPELREQIAQMKLNIVTSEDDEDFEKEAKKDIPEAFKAHMFKSKDADSEEDSEEGEDEDKDDCDVVEGKKATARRRRIRFTCASQISPEAITAAKEQGDEELYKAILAARNDVRIREAEQLMKSSEEALKREASALSKRSAFRMTVVKNAEQTRQAVASVANVKTAKVEDNAFKTVKSMTGDEKNYFRRIALDKGMPEEYVNSMFASDEDTTSASSDVENIRDIMASNLNSETKKAAIGGMAKVAKLDNENIARLKKYWKEELGYGDEAWIDDLFTNKYDK